MVKIGSKVSTNVRSYKVGSPYEKGKGAHKILHKADESPNNGVFKVPKNFYKDVAILNVRSVKPDNIYKELNLYRDFGLQNISPKVYQVKLKGVKEPVSLLNFISNYQVDKIPPEYLLVEESICGEKILDFYGSKYLEMFSKLREFLEKKIVGTNGYVNTDIKLENLCIDKNGEFKMIDLDPNFIQEIEVQNDQISNEDYVNYMLFQVYCLLCRRGKLDLNFKDIFAICKTKNIVEMISKLKNFFIVKNRSERTHPLNNLLYYSGISDEAKKNPNYYDDGDELYSAVIDSISKKQPKQNVVHTNSPTAMIPTASETEMISTDDTFYTNDNPSVFYNAWQDMYPSQGFSSQGGRKRRKTKKRVSTKKKK